MNKIFAPFLPPWVETGLQPAFYDMESGTVLQQTARMYAKVQQLTRLFNELSEETKTTVEEYIAKFTELKDFVDDYFDNLDVQEEINNKLDAMVEDGTLAEIIDAYLQPNVVWSFDVVADIASANNLQEGNRVKTFGYLRKGDGVYDNYIVRQAEENEVADGYNTVAITGTTLIAERQQYGKDLVIELLATDNIQSYLNLVGKKTIVLPKGTTITVGDALMVNSDTEINLNGSTIKFDYARPASFPAVDWDETLGFVSFTANDTFTGYTGNKNITIRNGKIMGGCSCFLHTTNILIEDVEFEGLASRHAMQFAACYNGKISKCIFNGTLHQAGDEEAAECINIDPCTHGGQPWLNEDSPMYDDTPNKFFTIDANKFNQPTLAGQLYACGAGSHGGANTSPIICDNITFTNNDFGDPYKDAVNLRDYNNAVVANNTMKIGSGSHDDHTSFVHIRGGVTNVNINNNLAQGVNQFAYTDSNQRVRKDIVIESNTIEAADKSGYAVIQLFHSENVYVKNNSIKYTYRVLHTDALYSGSNLIAGTESKNVNFKENEITTTGGGDVVLRFQQTLGVNVIGNVINYVGVNNMAWEYTIALQTGTTDAIVMHNVTSDPRHFVNVSSMTDKFMYNNAIYQLSNSSGTSISGTLAKPLVNFTKLVLPLGDTAHTQFVELQPWTPTNRNKFFWGDDKVRIYKFPVAKSDNTIGIGALTINNDNTFSYSGDVSLRSIYARD